MAGISIKEKEIMAPVGFSLPKGQVHVKFIRVQRGSIVNEKHVAFGGLLESSSINLPARKLNNGNYANVLTKAEKEGIERLMSLEEDSLSVYKKTNNFWDTIDIKLTKEGLNLDLEDPTDFCKVKVLQSYPDLIAGSLTEYSNNPKSTQKFVLEWPDEKSVTFNKTMDVQMEAFMAFGKIESSESALRDLLSMYGIKVAEDSSKEWIREQAGMKVKTDPKGFLAIIADPNYNIKILLKKALAAGAIKVNGGLYQTVDGINLSSPNVIPNLPNVLNFLSSNEGQDMRIRLESEITIV